MLLPKVRFKSAERNRRDPLFEDGDGIVPASSEFSTGERNDKKIALEAKLIVLLVATSFANSIWLLLRKF